MAYFNTLYDNNVLTDIHIIGGNCYETEEDFNKSLEFIKQLRFDCLDYGKSKLIVGRLKVHPKTEIIEIVPKVVTEPMPVNKWLYRAALCHLIRVTTEEEFAEIRSMKFYEENPDLLAALYRNLLEKKAKITFEANC